MPGGLQISPWERAAPSYSSCDHARTHADSRRDSQLRATRPPHSGGWASTSQAAIGPRVNAMVRRMTRGLIHHVDLTVRDPWASRAFYETVLGFLGYRQTREDERGFDFERLGADGSFCSLGLMRAAGPNADRRHDRGAPGLHHIAWHAESHEDVDTLHRRLVEQAATILDPRPSTPSTGPATTHCSSPIQTGSSSSWCTARSARARHRHRRPAPPGSSPARLNRRERWRGRAADHARTSAVRLRVTRSPQQQASAVATATPATAAAQALG